MINKENVISIIRKGKDEWNYWKQEHYKERIDLSDTNFLSDIFKPEHVYDITEFNGYDFSHCNLNRVSFRNCIFSNCNFDSSMFHFSDMCFGNFNRCTFIDAELNVSKIGSAYFNKCNFTNADLSYCSAEDADFSNSTFINSNLSYMSLVKTSFRKATIEKSLVYGISAWDINTKGAAQSEILITPKNQKVSVDNIEIAQFIYIMINNKKIRNIIDTITAKVILVLGRFTSERKPVLDFIKKEITKNGYVPVLFDFSGPESRDITETVSTLAHMSKYIIADITSPRSIPQELQVIIPNLPSVTIQPIIEGSEREYGMFEHFYHYPWVNKIKKYADNNYKFDIKNIVSDLLKA